MDAGLHLRTPIVQSVVKINVQTQKEQVDASAASKDLQDVTTTLALNYHLAPEGVGKLYQNIGIDYKSRVIDPAIQEAIKGVTAKYTAEELVTRREEVKSEAKQALSDRLLNDFIIVDDLSIVNFAFSDSFNKAIEEKVTAEQDALAAKNKLEQIKYEAEQTVTTATAAAQAIKIKADALAQNQELVKFNAVEKWDGKLPTYMGSGPVPFLDLSK